MTQQTQTDGRLVRRYDYADRTVVAADVGSSDAIHAEAVGERALVVVERADGEEEFELDLPGPAASVDTNNGVLTITVER